MFKYLALILCLTPRLALAQSTVSGDWLLTEEIDGNPLHQKLTLKVEGTALSGTLARRPVDGTANGAAIRFTLRNDNVVDEFSGTLSADGMAGTLVRSENGRPATWIISPTLNVR